MYYASVVAALSVSLTHSINLFYFALDNKFSNLAILENFTLFENKNILIPFPKHQINFSVFLLK